MIMKQLNNRDAEEQKRPQLLRATEQTCYEGKIISYEYSHRQKDGDRDDDDTIFRYDADALHDDARHILLRTTGTLPKMRLWK